MEKDISTLKKLMIIAAIKKKRKARKEGKEKEDAINREDHGIEAGDQVSRG